MISFLNKYSQLIVGLGFLFYFLYTLSSAIEINQNLINATWLSVIIYGQTVGVFLYFYRKNGKPRLQDWLRLMIFMTLTLNFMSIVNSANGSSHVPFVNQTISLNDSAFAMIVIIFTLIALDIAYFIYRTFKTHTFTERQFTVTHKNIVFMLLILSTTFKGYLLFSGISGFGSNHNDTSGLVSFVSMLSNYLNPFALIVTAYILYIEKNTTKRFASIFYSMLIVQILIGILSGMKENAIEPILFTLIVFLLAGRKVSKNLIAAGLFLLILLYPLNNAYRNVVGNPYLNTGSSVLSMAIAIKKIANQPLSETLLGGVESYGDRGAMFPFFLYAIEHEPEWNTYKYMDRYLTMPVAIIVPRFLWKDKPTADTGGVLYAMITGERTATAVTPTTLGWAYFEGGIFFVFIIFFILGLILEFVERQNINNPIVLLLYASLLHKTIKPEWDPYFMMISIILMFIIYWLLLKFIGMKRQLS